MAKKIGRFVAAIAVVVIAAAVIWLFVLPEFNKSETRYLSESSLEEVTDIDKLICAECFYNGIAEHHERLNVPGAIDTDYVDYRVKYESRFQAYICLADMEYSIDEETRTVTATLPEIQVSTAVLDTTTFGYLPENITGDIQDVITICKEDAAESIDADGLRAEALENVKEIVERLVSPLLKDDVEPYTLEFVEGVQK